MKSFPLHLFLILAAGPIPLQAQQPPQEPPPAVRPDSDDIRLKNPPPEKSTSLTPTLLDRSSATVSVITGPDLQALGVRTLTDALRIIPGMEVQKISATESAVSVRSYTGPSTQGILGLVDGRQITNEFLGGIFWESLPVTMDEIKSIEVIRGPGSFLYGPNAMHGLVNIVTRSPLDYNEGEVFLSAQGGSYGSNVETLTYAKRAGNAGLKVTLTHDDINQFQGSRDTRNKLFMDLRYRTRLDDHQELELTGGASRQQFDVLFPPISPSGNTLPTATYATRAQEYFFKANYYLADSLKAQFSWTHFIADGLPDFVYTPFSLILNTLDLDVQYSIAPLAGHRMTLGTGYRYAGFETHDYDISGGPHSTSLGWVFVQDEVSLGHEVFLTGGARLDAHSTAGASVSPRASIVWEFIPATTREVDGVQILEPGQSLRATVGYGFRNPGLRDLWFNMQINPFPPGLPLPPFNPAPNPLARVVGNPNLKPEEMRSFEVGYWGRPTARLQAECSVYYNLCDGLVAYQSAPTSTPLDLQVARYNQNKEDAYGVEANVEVQVSHEVYAFGNYAYEVRRDRVTHARIPDGPRHKANAGIRINNEKSLSGMVWMNYFDRSDFTDTGNRQSLGMVPAYTLLNVKVWYPIQIGAAAGRIFLQGFNLLDHIHREHPLGDAYGLIGMAGVEITW